MKWNLRLARIDDVPSLEELIPLSVRALQSEHYSPAQMEAALGPVFGVDRQLIADGTYFVAEEARRIGSITLMRIDPANGTAELGWIWYAPSAQRTKANTEANFLLLRHCFAELGYRRMEWKCDSENVRSRAAALRLGYSFEGIFRQHMVVKGRSRDTAWFSMLDHEWPRVAGAMERWLYVDDSQPLAARRTDARPEQ